MKKIQAFFKWLMKPFFKKEAQAPVLKMNPPKKSAGRKVNYEVDCTLYIENKKVGFFPLTVHSYSKQHVQKMLEEGVRLEASNIRTAKVKA